MFKISFKKFIYFYIFNAMSKLNILNLFNSDHSGHKGDLLILLRYGRCIVPGAYNG